MTDECDITAPWSKTQLNWLIKLTTKSEQKCWKQNLTEKAEKQKGEQRVNISRGTVNHNQLQNPTLSKQLYLKRCYKIFTVETV